MQAAPGGPVDQLIAELRGTAGTGLGQVAGGGGELRSTATTANENRGARGLDPDFIAQLNKLYGFDKPAPERFWLMLKDYLHFDFGTSFYQGQPVIKLIAEKLPVSISLGLWTTLLIYLISIPLGIRKAVQATAAPSMCGAAASSSSAMRSPASCSPCC